MRKLKENPTAKQRSVQGMMAETNMNRNAIMKIAESAGAIIRYGNRGIRINAERFYAYLEQEAK